MTAWVYVSNVTGLDACGSNSWVTLTSVLFALNDEEYVCRVPPYLLSNSDVGRGWTDCCSHLALAPIWTLASRRCVGSLRLTIADVCFALCHADSSLPDRRDLLSVPRRCKDLIDRPLVIGMCTTQSMFKKKYIPWSVATGLAAVVGWYFWGLGGVPLTNLTPANFETFTQDFDRSTDTARVVVLLSPT